MIKTNPTHAILLSLFHFLKFTYLTPYRALQLKSLRQILQHELEVVVTVIISFPHHQLANYIRHSIVEETCCTEKFT